MIVIQIWGNKSILRKGADQIDDNLGKEKAPEGALPNY